MKLRYASGGILVAALVLLPSGAAARHNSPIDGLSAQACAHERAAIGKKAFSKKYGAKHTMRTCARKNRSLVQAAIRVANEDCQDELTQVGDATFIDEYGDDATDTVENSMAECVAEGVDEALNPDTGDDGGDDGSDL
ncbi:MAG: hypothetical protein ACJ75Z_10230 [Solirubrobacterales bacterium]